MIVWISAIGYFSAQLVLIRESTLNEALNAFSWMVSLFCILDLVLSAGETIGGAMLLIGYVGRVRGMMPNEDEEEQERRLCQHPDLMVRF
jgi:hypothetical protein